MWNKQIFHSHSRRFTISEQIALAPRANQQPHCYYGNWEERNNCGCVIHTPISPHPPFLSQQQYIPRRSAEQRYSAWNNLHFTKLYTQGSCSQWLDVICSVAARKKRLTQTELKEHAGQKMVVVRKTACAAKIGHIEKFQSFTF
jgi:hypothetical protein